MPISQDPRAVPVVVLGQYRAKTDMDDQDVVRSFELEGQYRLSYHGVVLWAHVVNERHRTCLFPLIPFLPTSRQKGRRTTRRCLALHDIYEIDVTRRCAVSLHGATEDSRFVRRKDMR